MIIRPTTNIAELSVYRLVPAETTLGQRRLAAGRAPLSHNFLYPSVYKRNMRFPTHRMGYALFQLPDG